MRVEEAEMERLRGRGSSSQWQLVERAAGNQVGVSVINIGRQLGRGR